MESWDILRRATKEQLDSLEHSSFFDAVVDEGPPYSLYVAWLRIMAVVVRTLEHALDESEDAGVRGLWREQRRALPLLVADLVALDEVPALATPAIEPMLELVGELRHWGRAQPVQLLGVLHARGSMLGGSLLHERLAGRLGPGATGLTYVSAHAGAKGPSWGSFRRRINALELTSHALEHIAQASRSFVVRMDELVAALQVRDDGEHSVVEALNSDAGHHAVTCDPREVMAAIDAGVRTWEQHPYYEARYGARGHRFTRSDSAWLVVLAGLSERARLEQLDWLAKLLASRGMPSLLLEIHLDHLHEALVAAVPERADRYGGLEAASHRLRDRRLAALPDFDELAASVPYHDQLGNVGPILASAFADERQGIRGAVASVEGWITDPGRFGAAWIAAVRHALDLARR